MPEQLETLILGENELRLERIKLPNGNTYILGCSFEEAQEIYDVLIENIEAVNEDVEGLKESEKVAAMSLNDLNSRVTALTEDVEDLKDDNETTSETLSEMEEDVSTIKDNEIVISASLNDLNSRIVALTAENAELRNEITQLLGEIALIKRNYMAYYDVNESEGIGEQNIYTR